MTPEKYIKQLRRRINDEYTAAANRPQVSGDFMRGELAMAHSIREYADILAQALDTAPPAATQPAEGVCEHPVGSLHIKCGADNYIFHWCSACGAFRSIAPNKPMPPWKFPFTVTPAAEQEGGGDGWVRTSEMTPKDFGLGKDDHVIVCSDDSRGSFWTYALGAHNHKYWQPFPKPPAAEQPAADYVPVTGISDPEKLKRYLKQPAAEEERTEWMRALAKAHTAAHRGRIDQLRADLALLEILDRNPSAGAAGEEG